MFAICNYDAFLKYSWIFIWDPATTVFSVKTPLSALWIIKGQSRFNVYKMKESEDICLIGPGFHPKGNTLVIFLLKVKTTLPFAARCLYKNWHGRAYIF